MNPHARRPTNFSSLIESTWGNRSLVRQLTRRDIAGRYRGSLAGLTWTLLTPLVMLAIYTFVFSVVFKARWGAEAATDRGSFAVILFVGILVQNVFSECVNRAPGLVLANVGYVKRVVFPIEVLPWVAMGTALFHALASLAVLLVAEWFVMGHVPWTAVFLPLVALPLVLFTMGVSWLFAAVGVYIRDLGQLTTLLTTAMLFLSPVFYPVSALPERYQVLFRLNPLTYIIEESREVLIWGRVPQWGTLLVYSSVSLLLAWLGYWAFQRMRPGFADVL